jgi:hypothetical protein
MHKRSLRIGLAALLGMLLVVPAWGQAMPGSPKPKRGYNPATTEIISGTVEGVNRTTPKKANVPAQVQLLLRTDRETLTVNCGPATYYDQQNFSLAPGDQVEVKGSKITRPKGTMVMAAEVRKGSQVLRLRDEAGRPLWPRTRKMQPQPGM